MKTIDNFLNRITMYRLALYELIGLLIVAAILGFFKIMPYSPDLVIFSACYITVVCWVVNKIFAWAYNAPSNPESVYITALILALIISPAMTYGQFSFLVLAFWAGALAMASKYILAIGKKHIFNPAAIAVVITSFALNQSATWWVGTASMLPFVLIGGLLLTRKIQRFDLVLTAIAASLVTILGPALFRGGNVAAFGWNVLATTPLFFFTTVMLTEPLTTPPTRPLRIVYGIIVGILFSPTIHLGPIYTIPELGLVIGNVFSYLVSPKKKLVLVLKKIEQISPDSADFVFRPENSAGKPDEDVLGKFSFAPGQYMEWTLAHKRPDTRGIRRYFTIASSPTENEIRLGVKFNPKGSTFKKKLLSMQEGDTIVASGLAGDFTLPRNKKKKLALVAGGIGVTPFRSQIQYLLDKNETRPIIVLFSNKTVDDVVYKSVFDQAERQLGIKTTHAITNPGADISRLPGAIRAIDSETIARTIPDYRQRFFYLSGPQGMIKNIESTLRKMGVKRRHIKTDFFPGFA